MKKNGLGVLIAMLLVVGVACADAPILPLIPATVPAAQPAAQPTTVAPASPSTQPAVQPEQPVVPAGPPADYKIQQDDIMRIDLMDEPSVTQTVTVDPQGYVNVNYIGQIYAKDLTVPQLIVKVEKGLSKYYVDPKVSLSMVTYRKPKIQVIGQFNRPGQYDYIPGGRIMDAIALAGSFTDLAYLEGATLTHKDSKESIPLDLKALYKNGDLSKNISLQDDDTIYIPEDTTNWYFVLGQVARPGKYRLKDKETVIDAVSNAVFTDRAKTEATYVIRGEITGDSKKPTPGTKNERIKCDLRNLFKKADMKENIALKPGDVVYVPETSSPDWNKISSVIGAIVNASYLPSILRR